MSTFSERLRKCVGSFVEDSGGLVDERDPKLTTYVEQGKQFATRLGRAALREHEKVAEALQEKDRRLRLKELQDVLVRELREIGANLTSGKPLRKRRKKNPRPVESGSANGSPTSTVESKGIVAPGGRDDVQGDSARESEGGAG